MDGIIILLILYFLFHFIFKKMKSLNTTAKQKQAATEISGYAPASVRPSVSNAKKDSRFPSQPAMQTANATPVSQEGRDPNVMIHEYTPISASPTLKSQFSDYQGSLKAPTAEGLGYQTETYDPIPAPYSGSTDSTVKILPDSLTRDTLVQAVVMSEILKRPGVRR